MNQQRNLFYYHTSRSLLLFEFFLTLAAGTYSKDSCLHLFDISENQFLA